MKLKSLLFAFTAFGLLASCSGDDDNGTVANDNEAKILGTWNLHSEKETINGMGSEETWVHFCDTKKDHVIFNENATFEWVEYNEDCTVNPDETNNDATWTVSGNTLTFGNDIEMLTAEILTLNETTLVVKDTYSAEGVDYTIVTTFKR